MVLEPSDQGDYMDIIDVIADTVAGPGRYSSPGIEVPEDSMSHPPAEYFVLDKVDHAENVYNR